ncbi:chloride channel protein [Cronbergia sp. UHCC 0137]|uniref:chloride channel protein n=1 Tax=Cronbergia sp. UHCC 0137 TaxID=3110239 RepID=UPI002B202014|nr:chloride channel protein [Cronbergia sp. UHCC 0137]MEA5617059.1 chloride channel protein [Cronbergia sp. UHCC 0137]
MLVKGKIFWLRLSRTLLKPRRLAFFEACLIGLVSGLAAVLLGQAVEAAGAWRVNLSYRWPAYLVLPAIGLVGGFLAGWLVETFAPEASGSGTSDVKAVLARVPLPLNLRIALIKLISAILVLGSGIPLGREGPTTQIGASLANQLSNWVPTSPEHRRQLIAAGSGAGLAAAFNAPIAGVLFVVEELLQDVSGITLGTAILASLIASGLSRLYGSQSWNLGLDVAVSQTTFQFQEIPFYLILGLLAGLLGILFNKSILAGLAFNRRVLHLSLAWRIGLAGLVTGIAIALLPVDFRNNAGLKDILLSGQSNWQFAAIAFIVQFILIVICYGSGAPAGLLVPTLFLGAALGYLVGATEYSLLGIGVPTTYAHVGMAAFLSAVSKVPITAVVIVFEMTTDFNLVLPLMIVSVVAYIVADKIDHRSLYDLLLEWKGIYINKKPSGEGLLTQISATDVMQRRVETLSKQTTIDQAIQAFSDSHHRHFPVMEKGLIVGILTQTDLGNIDSQRISGDMTISEIMTPEPITVSPTSPLSYVLLLLNRHNINCLPVTEGRKLVGIITRSDIIRVEAERLSGKTDQQIEPKSAPSCVIYQNRAPAIGKGRLLVPLSHPHTAQTLLEMAGAIAKERNYELECLQVILVPRSRIPAETPVETARSHRLLQQAVQLGEDLHIPIHTQIRVAHDVAGAVLETIKERHIDLLLMGWKGNTSTPGRVFSRVVDTLIRQAACEVVLVKLDETKGFKRWLLPLAGGPNSSEAVQLLPALTSLSLSPEIKLYQVFQPNESNPDTTILDDSVRFLQRKINGTIEGIPVCASSVIDTVIDCAQNDQTDVIILGASRESLLQQVIKGNIPETISSKSDRTVILVRTDTV